MPLATEAQADYEYARNVGIDNPGRAWILSDRNVWYRNPAYSGPPVPHPESDDDWGPADGVAISQPDDGSNDIPF